MLYGDSDGQRERALRSDDPVTLPWIAAALDRIDEVLADLAP
jgi:aspartate aminotransferase